MDLKNKKNFALLKFEYVYSIDVATCLLIVTFKEDDLFLKHSKLIILRKDHVCKGAVVKDRKYGKIYSLRILLIKIKIFSEIKNI